MIGSPATILCFPEIVIVFTENYNWFSIFIDLKDYYPSYIEIDLTGKYKIWEGVVKLPMINIDIFSNYYIRKKIHFTDEEHKRNIHGKTFFYTKTVTKNVFQSFYGKIKNNIITCEIIDI